MIHVFRLYSSFYRHSLKEPMIKRRTMRLLTGPGIFDYLPLIMPGNVGLIGVNELWHHFYDVCFAREVNVCFLPDKAQ